MIFELFDFDVNVIEMEQGEVPYLVYCKKRIIKKSRSKVKRNLYYTTCKRNIREDYKSDALLYK